MNLNTKFKVLLVCSALTKTAQSVVMVATKPSELEWLRFLYWRFLDREPDEAGVKHYFDRLTQARSLLRWKVRTFIDFLLSPEYWNRVAKSAFKFDPNEAHHTARIKWVQKFPKSNEILDLGGSSSWCKDGALFAMNYPHKSSVKNLTIIDFPPQDRVASSYSDHQEQDHQTSDGTKIKFIYDSFVNLAPFPTGKYDLIVAGQVIEHITEEEGLQLLKDCLRLLAPGGSMWLDTPNRLISKYVTGGFLHPEHKLEYEPDQLISVAEKAGWKVRSKGGISPMPLSLRMKRFLPHEICANLRLSENPNEGFSFFLELQKPNSSFYDAVIS